MNRGQIPIAKWQYRRVQLSSPLSAASTLRLYGVNPDTVSYYTPQSWGLLSVFLISYLQQATLMLRITHDHQN